MVNMKRIGFAVGYYDSFTGSQQSMLQLIKNCDAFDPVIITPEDGEFTRKINQFSIERITIDYNQHLDRFDKELMQDNIFNKTMTGIHLMSYYWNMIFELKKRDIDIVYLNDSRSVFLYLIPAKLLGIPVVWYVRADDPVPIVDHLGVRLADKIITISDGTRARFSEKNIDKFEGKFKTIYTGLDLSKYDCELRDDNNEPGIQIAQVGTIHPRKRPDLLIHAVGQIEDQLPKYNITFAGKIPDQNNNNYYNKLTELCKKYGIRDNVTFLGWHKEIPELLAQTDIHVLPSESEGLPRSVLEASAMRVPTVATPAGGTDEIINHGETGFIVPFDNSEQLGSSILLLAQNHEKRTSMGKKAREDVKKRFTKQRYITEFENAVNCF